jgi:hypothetical protein
VNVERPVCCSYVGFTDRFREAAEAARAKLAEHGVIGDADAIHGINVVAPNDSDLSVADRAMGRGAPDPFSLITESEVVGLTGIPVGGPSLTYTDDDLGVRFDAEDGHRRIWSFGVHAGHAADDDTRFDPVSWYQWMVALLGKPEPVPDLGDAAVYYNGMLYVRGEGRAFYVLVDAPDGSPIKEWATTLARRVLDRLASGEAG